MEAGRGAVAGALRAPHGRYGLTPREWETASLAAEGYTYEEIARRRRVSLSTVKFHLKNVYRKTGTSSRSALRRMLKT
jgi:LuxR family maltose regulon positive regulatory protein